MVYSYLLIVLLAVFILSCGRPAGVGVGGRYLDAKSEMVKGVRGDLSKAIVNLEQVVVREPDYEDSLTLLGRAYYRAGRYQDAYQILKRALALRPKDEIAWISVGLTELRLGSDARGMESLKGGLTLLSKASTDGYRGFDSWDSEGSVRAAIRRTAFLVVKGLEEKESILRHGELLLARVDDEEWWGKRKRAREQAKPIND